ncbi:MAG TPA: AEC family transporter [Sandaracinaceae bacterium LLY-WYZ-13_1]|nr:AEC family transporter [Sandaracinaceae bacterium LLY-WYZ-13_1]
MELTLAAAALVAPVFLGVGAGLARLFADPDAAVDHLNRYALYFAFPALVFHGLVAADYTLPDEPGFWLLVPAALAVTALAGRLGAPRQAGTLAQMVAFGNVAYLGLPVVERVLGEASLPAASLAVAVHVTLALSVGPVLLLRWSDAGGSVRATVSRAARQPLLWAPIVGLAARLLPRDVRAVLDALADPIGRSAAPVALFLLGLYLHHHRSRMRHLGGADALHVAMKLLVLPAVTFAGAWALHRVGWLHVPEAQILCLLSAMPAAITTFAIAQQLGVGAAQTSRAIVATTLAAAATVPLTAWLVLTWLPTW